MIISASRRTDIPSFYSDWFYNRIQEGFLLVRNPMNVKQVSKINLSPELVDCIVFWTKNPQPMIKRLSELQGYNYYFQFTLNSYDKSIEANVPPKNELIKTFIDLSQRIGKGRVIWRYDPILLSNRFNKEYHYYWFEKIACKLQGYTEKCVFSFIDLYTKTQRNMKNIRLSPLTEIDMKEMAEKLSNIAAKCNILLETCSEEIDLSMYNINHGSCIDDKLISKIVGQKLTIQKDSNQRELCGCVKSIDIGAYNSCKHDCIYCYANFNKDIVEKNCLSHNSLSPLLYGDLNGDENIFDRDMHSYMNRQISLFDL